MKPDYRPGIAGNIVRGHQAACAFIHDLANAARQIAHHRHETAAHGLQQGQRHAFVIRSQQEYVMFRQYARHIGVGNRPTK